MDSDVFPALSAQEQLLLPRHCERRFNHTLRTDRAPEATRHVRGEVADCFLGTAAARPDAVLPRVECGPAGLDATAAAASVGAVPDAWERRGFGGPLAGGGCEAQPARRDLGASVPGRVTGHERRLAEGTDFGGGGRGSVCDGAAGAGAHGAFPTSRRESLGDAFTDGARVVVGCSADLPSCARKTAKGAAARRRVQSHLRRRK